MATTLILSSLSVLLILLIILVFKLFKQNVYFKVIREHSSPYGFAINNEYDSDRKRVVLYGLNQYLLTPNFGSEIGIRLNPVQPHVSYLECLNQSAHQPFVTRTISFHGKINDIMDLILTFTSKDASGQVLQIPLLVRNYVDNNNVDLHDHENEQTINIKYEYVVDGNTDISFELNPKSQIKIYVYFNTIQYATMNVIGYIKNLIKGNLPNDNYYKTITPEITSLKND